MASLGAGFSRMTPMTRAEVSPLWNQHSLACDCEGLPVVWPRRGLVFIRSTCLRCTTHELVSGFQARYVEGTSQRLIYVATLWPLLVLLRLVVVVMMTGSDCISLNKQCKNGEKCEIVKLFHTLMCRPNLEPVEFWLFPKLKEVLKGQQLSSDVKVEVD